MTLDQQIEKILHDQYDSGRTQQEIASSFHVSQQQIQRILSGQRKTSGLTVKVLMKMFPRATFNLTGDTISGTNSGVINAVLGVNKGTFNANCESAIIDKILKSDLSAEDKVKFIELVRK